MQLCNAAYPAHLHTLPILQAGKRKITLVDMQTYRRRLAGRVGHIPCQTALHSWPASAKMEVCAGSAVAHAVGSMRPTVLLTCYALLSIFGSQR